MEYSFCLVITLQGFIFSSCLRDFVRLNRFLSLEIKMGLLHASSFIREGVEEFQRFETPINQNDLAINTTGVTGG
jgi:site-specific recombinase